MERGKTSMFPNGCSNILPALVSLISQLEACHSNQEYIQLLAEFELLAKTNPEIGTAHAYILAQYPTLSNIEPATIAKALKDHYGADSKKVPQLSLSLDSDSLQNIKKELRKTYQENNIGFLANEVDIGLEESLSGIPVVKREEASAEQPEPHIFAVPNGQVYILTLVTLIIENCHWNKRG